MNKTNNMNETKFADQILNALIHFLYNFIIYFIFILPFALWRKATIRLSEQRQKEGLNVSKIKSNWPFLSFLKKFIFDFLLDGFIFITYILAPIIAIILAIASGSFMSFLMTLVGAYFIPLALTIVSDFLQLSILPFKKFISWASKPAQYMDLEIKNK